MKFNLREKEFVGVLDIAAKALRLDKSVVSKYYQKGKPEVVEIVNSLCEKRQKARSKRIDSVVKGAAV